MTIEIICPLYNAEEYIKNLDKNIKNQNNVKIDKISYVLTESNDNTEKILNEIQANYIKISKETFSHSRTREKIAMKSKSDIVVFISQDIEIKNNNWLENLVKPIINEEAVATYSRQISKYNNIEKYTREANYPNKSIIKSKEDIAKLGITTFLFSDVSSAIKKSIFIELKGYDEKNLPINEDMYIAYKIIMKGYKIKYCADSIVWHSHNFSLKQLYERYKLVGQFFRDNSYLDKYKVNNAGENLAKYVLKRTLQEKNWKVLINFIPNMLSRFIGMQVGKRLRG